MRNQLHSSKEKWRKAGNTANHVLRCASLPVDVFRGGTGLRAASNNPLYIAGAAALAIAVHTVWQNGVILWADKTDWNLVILPPHKPSALFLAFVSIALSAAIHNFAASFYRTVIKKQPGDSKDKGRSFVSYLFPNLDDGAYFLEAAFWFSCGVQMTRLCPLTGGYIIAASIALLCRLAIGYASDTRRRISIDDLSLNASDIRPNIRHKHTTGGTYR